MRKDNKGFSLIELIIVIAIMTVMMGAIGFTFSLISGKEAKKCANNISAALDKAKIYCMEKSGSTDAYIEISKESNNRYIARYYVPDNPVKGTSVHVIEEDKIGNGNVNITCSIAGTTKEIQGTDTLKVSYNRLNGGIKSASIGGTTGNLQSIQVKRGRTYTISVIQSTGKNTVKRN